MVSKYTQYKISCLGNGTFHSNSIARGKIHKVTVNYENDSHADTDVTLKDEAGNTVVVAENTNTSFTAYPTVATVDSALDERLYANEGEEVATQFLVFGRLEVVVADNLADKTVDVRVLVEEY